MRRPLVLILLLGGLSVSLILVRQTQLFGKKAAILPETVYFVHADHLGSTSVITDSAGNAVSNRAYFAYGATRSQSGSDPTDHLYTGQVSDTDETGLYYYNARYYSPTLAKFTQADPVNDQLNRYAYVTNNPINLSDPSGNRFDEGSGGSGGNKKRNKARFDNEIIIPDQAAITNSGEYQNDPLLNPEYSNWRDLVSGSPCTGCHVTHTFTQDGIPTNEELDPELVKYYRSLDWLAPIVHQAAFTFVGNLSSLSTSYTDEITLYHGSIGENHPSIMNSGIKGGSFSDEVTTPIEYATGQGFSVGNSAFKKVPVSGYVYKVTAPRDFFKVSFEFEGETYYRLSNLSPITPGSSNSLEVFLPPKYISAIYEVDPFGQIINTINNLFP